MLFLLQFISRCKNKVLILSRVCCNAHTVAATFIHYINIDRVVSIDMLNNLSYLLIIRYFQFNT